jgi:ABC-type nitrate/sulfonate/bicarbonate transport system ATPase subunit
MISWKPVTLSDRVLVMSRRPGRIIDEIADRHPGPRRAAEAPPAPESHLTTSTG